MAKPYYLIDFENVQPKALDRLTPGAARIKVFLGEHQTRLMLELVQALQPFGTDAEYIAISGSGPDAVDFHIAFYIGRLAATEPGTAFLIVSKDRGFDPLVRHLNAQGIPCQRVPEIPGADVASVGASASAAQKKAAKPATKVAAKKAATKKASAKATVSPAAAKPPTAAKGTSTPARVAEVVARLKKSSKPAKVSTLRSSIKSWFQPALDDAAVEAIVQSLQTSRAITITGTKVTYALV